MELQTLLNNLEEAINKARESFLKVDEDELMILAEELGEFEEAQWTRAYINSLPDSAFIYIEPGYKEGENKNARHLPYKDKEGKVDLPHLRNALARCNQIKPVLGKVSAATARKTACTKAQKLGKKHLKTKKK